MSKQTIFIGNTANDRTGDPLRTAFQKVNDNFDELYSLAGADVQIPVQTGNSGKVLTTDGTTLSWTDSISISDFGDGFSLTNANKIVTNKLYSTNQTNSNQHYRLTLDTNGVVVLPDQSIINGATLRVVPGTGDLNYAALAAGPDTDHPEQTWIWADSNGAWLQTNSYITDSIKWHFDNSGHLVFPAGSEHYDLGAGDSILSHNIKVNNNVWAFNSNGDLELPSGTSTTSGAIQQRTTRTVTQGTTTVEAGSSGLIYSGDAWQTGFKLVIMVETRLDDNTDDLDHTQVCEAAIAANYNSYAEPIMSVYGLVYTSPTPLATFEVHRTGPGNGSGSINVYATNLQAQYNLQVSVHAIQFGSFYN
jgi:hypothetical protein